MNIAGGQPLNVVKEFELNGKKVRIGSIPAIPGIELFTECSSIVDATRWEDINSKGLTKLAAFASVEIAGVVQRLDSENAINAILSVDELWRICLEVYAANFGFFIHGGTPVVLGPLIEARKEELAKVQDKVQDKA